jgi:hypothetical protein
VHFCLKNLGAGSVVYTCCNQRGRRAVLIAVQTPYGHVDTGRRIAVRAIK